MIFLIGSKKFDVDLRQAQKDLDALEQHAGLQGRSPSLWFLQLVVAHMEQAYGVNASVAEAWAFWWAIAEVVERLRARYERKAEIGHWLHLQASTPEAEIGLHENISRIKAQSRLHQGKFDPTDFRAVYLLVLLATGDENAARAAQADAAERYVDMKVKQGEHDGN